MEYIIDCCLNVLLANRQIFHNSKKVTIEEMQKHIWRKAQINTKSQSQPIPRWGHNCCVIDQEVVFFGGYAGNQCVILDSNYMNDVWSYNTTTMEWKEVKTTGDTPSNRSNCSMNYDKENNRIIVFGGGGPNKKRFNTINILDWTTKDWLEIQPKENQPAPWERTYHSAQLVYPYLIVYGGEGIADMDDLWIYNFLTLSWAQVPIDKSKPRPCARRFHSSALVGTQFFIIAGCHSKYRPLNDVYSMDLSSLISNGSYHNLEWKERKFKGSAFLTRWGQTSSVYDNKIYIFGGRFSSDLNDILVIDLQRQTMKALKVGSQLPKPRRRHCGCFIGSCMMIFGGFNGEYFNDLYYINVFELKSKLMVPNFPKILLNINYLNKVELSDHTLRSNEGKQLPIHKGIIINCFSNQQKMESFLKDIEAKLNWDELIETMRVLYQGYGKIDDLTVYKYQIKIASDQEEREAEYRKEISMEIDKNENEGPTIGKRSTYSSTVSSVITLDDNQFSDFLERRRNPTYSNLTIVVNEQYQIKANSIPIVLSSAFFSNFLSTQFSDYQQNKAYINIPANHLIIFQIILNYLYLDYVVVPTEMGYRQWVELSKMAEFYCLGRLLNICEQQLCLKVNQQNYKQIMKIALDMEMEVLAIWCADFQLKMMISKEETAIDLLPKDKMDKKQQILKMVFQLLRFDIYQTKLERDRIFDTNMKKKESLSTQGQKQNYQINYNQ